MHENSHILHFNVLFLLAIWPRWFNYFSTMANVSSFGIGRNDGLFWYSMFEDVLLKTISWDKMLFTPWLHRAVHILRILEITHRTLALCFCVFLRERSYVFQFHLWYRPDSYLTLTSIVCSFMSYAYNAYPYITLLDWLKISVTLAWYFWRGSVFFYISLSE